MARKDEKQGVRRSGLRRVKDAVTGLFGRRRGEERAQEPARSAMKVDQQQPDMGNAAKPGRVTRREADIPLDVIDRSYNPPFTGGKAGFRSDGADHQNDQEMAYGVHDERWNDEDRLTNKSGDPRIGTHRRTYEPAEQPESRD